jgi:hypothetical protein
MRLNISVQEPRVLGGGCVRCGRPIIDVFRAVVHHRVMYHPECWLQLMSAAHLKESNSKVRSCSSREILPGGQRPLRLENTT